MFAWHEEENLRQSIRRIVGTSLFWLMWGILAGLLLALQRPLPWLFEQWSWWNSTRLQLYHGGLLLFGFAIPLLYACWMLRLRQLNDGPLRWITFWDWGHTLWQFALAWGVLGAFFGDHSGLPTWVWQPIIYGLLMVASASMALGFAFNLPSKALTQRPIAVRLLLVGTWALPMSLLFFLLAPQLREVLSPSLLQTILVLSLLFPLIGLMLPLSLSLPNAPDYRRLAFFFWGALLCTPLASSTFSSAIGGSLFFFVLQLGAVLALVALLYTLVSWWRYPALYSRHWSLPAHTMKPPTPALPVATYEETDEAPEAPLRPGQSQPDIWQPFYRWGGIFFAIAAVEAGLFALLRAIGHPPSPTWSLSHHHLLLVGVVVLWLQGSICLLFEPASETYARIRRLRTATVAGVLLFSLGNWWEGLLHFYLEQNGLPRGTIHSVSGQWLRALGGVCMFFALWWMGQSLTWMLRNIDRLRYVASDDA